MAVRQLGNTEHTFIASILAYVGIDPQKEVHWVTHPFETSTQLFAEGQSMPSRRNRPNRKNFGRCRSAMCSSTARSTGPGPSITAAWCIRTRRLSSSTPERPNGCCGPSLKAADLCTADRNTPTRYLVEKGYTTHYAYARETMQDVVYRQWREYNPEDTVRFYALRMQEAGMIRSTPQKIIAQGTDWRFFNALKKELKG